MPPGRRWPPASCAWARTEGEKRSEANAARGSAEPVARPLSPRPALILLADGAHLREVTLVDGLRHQPLTLHGTSEKPAEAAKAEAKPPVSDDPYEQIRK